MHNYGFDAGSTGGIANSRIPYAANYSPAFNLAADFKYDNMHFFLENTMVWNGVGLTNVGGRNVQILGETFVNTLTAGATYHWTSRMSFTGMFDWGWVSTPKLTWNTPGFGRSNTFRGSIGGQYDFGNGIVLQAAYAHTWNRWNIESNWRHTDEITVQSVVSF